MSILDAVKDTIKWEKYQIFGAASAKKQTFVCRIKPWGFYFVSTLRCVLVPTVDGADTDCGRLDDAPQHSFLHVNLRKSRLQNHPQKPDFARYLAKILRLKVNILLFWWNNNHYFYVYLQSVSCSLDMIDVKNNSQHIVLDSLRHGMSVRVVV